MSDIPPWLEQLATDARLMLGIDDGWKIAVVIDPKASEGEATAVGGEVTCNTVYLEATVRFTPGVTDDELGRQIVLHEFAHIALAPLYEIAERAFELLSDREAALLRSAYSDEEERVIQRMTRGITRMVAPPAMAAVANGRLEGPTGL